MGLRGRTCEEEGRVVGRSVYSRSSEQTGAQPRAELKCLFEYLESALCVTLWKQKFQSWCLLVFLSQLEETSLTSMRFPPKHCLVMLPPARFPPLYSLPVVFWTCTPSCRLYPVNTSHMSHSRWTWGHHLVKAEKGSGLITVVQSPEKPIFHGWSLKLISNGQCLLTTRMTRGCFIKDREMWNLRFLLLVDRVRCVTQGWTVASRKR